MVTINPNHVDLDLYCPIGWSNSQTHILHIKLHLHLPTVQLLSYHVIQLDMICIYVMPPQSWGDQGDTKHSKCLLLGGRRLNQMTLIPKLKRSGGAWAATAQVGPANKRNDTKRCLPFEASLRPGEAVPW